jgi:hypothetical protein
MAGKYNNNFSLATVKQYKKRFYLLLVIMSLSIISLAMFASSGCSTILSSESAAKIDVENPESSSQGNSDEASQDAAALEEGQEDLPEIDYRSATAGAEMVGQIPSFLCTNKDNLISIKITNTGDFPWRNERPGIVRVGYHYYGQDVDFVDYDGTSRSTLPNIVNPGETVTVLVLINNIENPGNYVIQIDPVLEGNDDPESNFWFSSKGVKMIEGLAHFDECTN